MGSTEIIDPTILAVNDPVLPTRVVKFFFIKKIPDITI